MRHYTIYYEAGGVVFCSTRHNYVRHFLGWKNEILHFLSSTFQVAVNHRLQRRFSLHHISTNPSYEPRIRVAGHENLDSRHVSELFIVESIETMNKIYLLRARWNSGHVFLQVFLQSSNVVPRGLFDQVSRRIYGNCRVRSNGSLVVLFSVVLFHVPDSYFHARVYPSAFDCIAEHVCHCTFAGSVTAAYKDQNRRHGDE
ncbi:hypothetical protein PGUG_01570 [Meyerozyma guilliermondii ATCC 6260]|uniref:Uncharacterized protein n=1 Tax=Meyerozyma guilliermondii (strain ATCC 6260 / CBS 566 / DSM 6381 / JCM 1539 / NBRC 10279 / NRRL Y-324) TaxID=294746 RepID=A5DE69_PICGU|nr:uncharacterized protein PGUG_01570 [Meyerozyma guilliermondii ATCC 6260]EDK37473.2 hypothetical protein PGUG_01570 [Meyerozyma guilliermondii ATCC 6260]